MIARRGSEPRELEPVELRFQATRSSGDVSALLLRPQAAHWLFVLGHGAGAGMRHLFLEGVARALASRGIATLRYQFPYSERRSRRPDPQPILLATVRSAVAVAAERAGDLPLLAGGKSMGGRMTSLATAESPLPGVRGLIFLGFPLHPAGERSTARADHLTQVTLPMLFLQGTRDDLADLELLRPVCDRLGGRATLHVVHGADHSFHMPARSGRTDEEVIEEIAEVIVEWSSGA